MTINRNNATLSIDFELNPKNYETLSKYIFNEINNITSLFCLFVHSFMLINVCFTSDNIHR